MSAIDELEKNWGSRVVLNLSEPKIITVSAIGNCTTSVTFSAKPHWRSTLPLSNGKSISDAEWQFSITGHQDLEGSDGQYKWVGTAAYYPASEFSPKDQVQADVSIDQRQLEIIIAAISTSRFSLAAELDLMNTRSSNSEVWNVESAGSLPVGSVRFRIAQEDESTPAVSEEVAAQLGAIRSELSALSNFVHRALPWIIGLTAACAAALLIF